MHRLTNAVRPSCLALLLGACGSEPPPAPMPEAASVSLEGVGDEVVHGTIAGEPFEAVSQRFAVVTRAGRERVDLLLVDRPMERCGLPMRREDRRVWIRFRERTAIEPGTYERLDEGEAPFEVHYELPGERNQFRTSHRGVGRIEVREGAPRTIEGVLRVCFADAEGSCVTGSFRATPCLSRIDGRTLREAPGLSDEAIETAGTAP